MLDLFHTLQDLQGWDVSLVAQTGVQLDLRTAQGKPIATRPRSCNWSRPASPIGKSVIGSESVKTPYSAPSNVTVPAAPRPPNEQIEKLHNTVCVQRNLEKADQVLNEIYAVVIKELSAGTDDPNPLFNDERKRTLISAQRVWVKFKDTQCAAVYALVAPATAAPAISGQCMIDLIHEKIQFLRRGAEQIHWDSKLCKADKMSCALPPDSPSRA